MDEAQKKRLDEIMAGMECPRGFQHCKFGFEKLCKAKDNGLKRYVECLEDEFGTCEFRVPFRDGVFCKCPVRVYIAKELKI